ncbi:MAG: transglutaminase-like cysteine peptidase [Rhizobiaceae bacterium]
MSRTTKRILSTTACAAAIVLWSVGSSAAANAMRTGGVTSQPIGHHEFCKRLPDECRQKTSSDTPVELTRKLWARMIEINNAYNTAVAPMTDQEMWGRPEYWSYPGSRGDCEDYVLAKRRALMQEGVPAGSLLITVVRQPNGDGHAVLTVRTDLGDFILDNLEPRILAWEDTVYRYLKRQSNRYSGTWVRIKDGRDVVVGSVNN